MRRDGLGGTAPGSGQKQPRASSGPASAPREKDSALMAAHANEDRPPGALRKASKARSMKVAERTADHWTDQASVSRLAGVSAKTAWARATAAQDRPQVRMSRPRSATFTAWVSQTMAIIAP